jgi:hypothetical protein
MAVAAATTRRHLAFAMRSWFSGGCLGLALTLALLNPLMCLLHCAFMDRPVVDLGLRVQAFHCAMLHHHPMPVNAIHASPDQLPTIGLHLQLPRAFYEMSLTMILAVLLLIVIATARILSSHPSMFLSYTPLAPPPKR